VLQLIPDVLHKGFHGFHTENAARVMDNPMMKKKMLLEGVNGKILKGIHTDTRWAWARSEIYKWIGG